MNGNGSTGGNLFPIDNDLRAETLEIPIHEQGHVRTNMQLVHRNLRTGQWADSPKSQEQNMSLDVVTSEDANVVSRFFNDVANRIIQASELAKQLDQLRFEFDQLKHEVESYRQHNAILDETVNRLRVERNELQDKLASVNAENVSLTQSVNEMGATITRLERESDEWRQSYNHTSETLGFVQNEKDTANWKVVELEERLRSVTQERDIFLADAQHHKSVLDEIRSKLSGSTAILASVA